MICTGTSSKRKLQLTVKTVKDSCKISRWEEWQTIHHKLEIRNHMKIRNGRICSPFKLPLCVYTHTTPPPPDPLSQHIPLCSPPQLAWYTARTGPQVRSVCSPAKIADRISSWAPKCTALDKYCGLEAGSPWGQRTLLQSAFILLEKQYTILFLTLLLTVYR